MIDCHSHLTDERVFTQAETMIREAFDTGVKVFSLGGTHAEDWKRQMQLKFQVTSGAWGSDLASVQIKTNFGLHPWWVERMEDENELKASLEALRDEIKNADGLGETGLDFGAKRDSEKFTLQEIAFKKQLKMAKTLQKPLVLHIVKAHAEAIKMIRELGMENHPIQVHRFSGQAQDLQSWLALPNAFISFSGAKNILRVPAQLVSLTPLHRILIETDAPDGLSASKDLPAFYSFIAEKKQIDLETLKSAIYKNFELLYSRA